MEKETFSLSYEEMIFSAERLIIDCVDQIHDGQPDPHLWMERARAVADTWLDLAVIGGMSQVTVDRDYYRLLAMTTSL